MYYCVLCADLPFNPLACHPGAITAHPLDMSALLGTVVTFRCNYSGSARPVWDVFIEDGSTETLANSGVALLQPEGYLNHTSSQNGLSMLEVLVTRELNNSQFQCRITVDPSDVLSSRATLTVHGESVGFPFPHV